jgi:hypothetical protein
VIEPTQSLFGKFLVNRPTFNRFNHRYLNVLRSRFSQRRQVIMFQQKIEKNCSLYKLTYFFRYFQVPMFWKSLSDRSGRGR